MPHLRYRDPSGASAVLELRDKEVVVGRLPDCDLVIPSGVVSRRHARLVPRDGAWTIIDLRSAHGTFVNRLRVEEKALEPNDEIRIGEEVLVFSDKPVVPRLKVSSSGRAVLRDGITASQSNKIEAEDLPTGDPALPPVVDRKRVDEVGLVKAAMDATRLDLANLRADQPRKRGRATSEGELLALVRIADGIHRCPDIPSVCRTAVEMAMRATGADRGTMAVRDEKKRDFVPMAELHATKSDFLTAPVMVSRTFVREVMREKVALFARDTGADTKLSVAQSVVAL